MADFAGGAPTASEVIPAGHAPLLADDERREDQSSSSAGISRLALAALGVVFGDIGTSPVYTLRECFSPEHGLPLDAEHVLGPLWLIFWALIIENPQPRARPESTLVLCRAHQCQTELAPGDGTMARAPLFQPCAHRNRTEFFRIPPDRVIELGVEVEI